MQSKTHPGIPKDAPNIPKPCKRVDFLIFFVVSQYKMMEYWWQKTSKVVKHAGRNPSRHTPKGAPNDANKLVFYASHNKMMEHCRQKAWKVVKLLDKSVVLSGLFQPTHQHSKHTDTPYHLAGP